MMGFSAMTEIASRRLAEDLKRLSGELQQLVEARTAELSCSEQRWRVLLQVNNAVVTCLDREALFQAIAGALRGVVPFDRAALILDNPAEDVFRVLRVDGHPLPPITPQTWPREGSRTGWIVATGQVLNSSDLREDTRFIEHGPLVQAGILSALSVPLKAKDKVIVVVILLSCTMVLPNVLMMTSGRLEVKSATSLSRKV
jgi:hypothetical protein